MTLIWHCETFSKKILFVYFFGWDKVYGAGVNMTTALSLWRLRILLWLDAMWKDCIEIFQKSIKNEKFSKCGILQWHSTIAKALHVFHLLLPFVSYKKETTFSFLVPTRQHNVELYEIPSLSKLHSQILHQLYEVCHWSITTIFWR